jgi:2-oxoglutarate dehydrogenase E1 component
MTNQPKSFDADQAGAYLTSGNDCYLEGLYDTYLTDPKAVPETWQRYFSQLPPVTGAPEVPHEPIRRHFLALSQQRKGVAGDSLSAPAGHLEKQERVIELIAAFRRLGHLGAKIDPLHLMKSVSIPELTLAFYGLTEADQKASFDVGNFVGLRQPQATLSDLYQSLTHIYQRTIGFEYMHINREKEVAWIRQRVEEGWMHFKPEAPIQRQLLQDLIAADGLEKYLGFKYVGQKRFSLEGGDSLIPLLRTITNRAAMLKAKEIVIGMAHRGRLNVLINILGKSPKELFAAFEGKNIPSTHSGDVKYHLGFSSNVKTPDGSLHLALAFNPSHLEIVSPVVQGSVRARQRRRKDTETQQVFPIQIHGDAAFAGQGVVMETFNLSQTRWFKVGGSIHIVINNQVGFTTDPKDARSTPYCTDIAKMVEAPILHVNADDPEAVYFAALFAIDYRHTFKRDVVIDLVCYRRHGHNEADEPSATQPTMYTAIKKLPATYQLYADRLMTENIITENEVKAAVDHYTHALDQNDTMVSMDTESSVYEYAANWEPFVGTEWQDQTRTAVPMERLQALGQQMAILPEGFTVQPQVKKMLEASKQMTAGSLPLQWGYAELMAYATLLDEGYPIRLCGQDVARGTFAHRHAILHDQKTNGLYIPLSHLSPTQAQINIIDSTLSEEAVLAFEYGYATAVPNFLVIWEAQFGDFANGAQVVIDQFISSGEQKWGRYCGLVMLLPHGYEGQGPEHSSARLERYLQLCAQDNMQVCVPTTPAQIFHLLRRQILRPYRKPLIVMSPKSMLRNPEVVSTLKDLSEGGFQVMIPEVDALEANQVTRVVFCAGKVYYDLLKKRRADKLNHVAILRIEQLYPFDSDTAKRLLATYSNAKEVVWCQEEPQNMGAWMVIQPYLLDLLKKTQTLHYAGRPPQASPAVGYHYQHEKEQSQVVANALLI